MSAAIVGELRVTSHRDGDDLLSAGLQLAGLRALPAEFSDPSAPGVAELRRRAIHSSWRGIADLGPLGGYAEIYGAVPLVEGREFSAFARVPGARSPHRVLLQVPDGFNRQHRCVVVTASSGSRGIYGSIAVAGAWGLPRGCAVAYTDKGAGSGYFDVPSQTGVALDGSRAHLGEATLEFAVEDAGMQAGILVKHANSGDNPEADWGEHVLQAAAFALQALDEAFPDEAPFNADNTRIIALGLSNGGGAVLRAASDPSGLIDGVVAIAPNIYSGQADARPLYDYVTDAALFAPCAMLDRRFDATPFARGPTGAPAAWAGRCAALHERGLLQANDSAGQAREAYAHLRAGGWSDAALGSAAASTALDLWKSIAVTYAAAYARSGSAAMPCGYAFSSLDAQQQPQAASAIERAAWWADASGIPPGAGVQLLDTQAEGADPSLPGLLCLRERWTSKSAQGKQLRASVAATRAQMPRDGLPLLLVHGADDGLIPATLSSDAYVQWLQANGRNASYWRVSNAQHFDAFLGFPAFGDRYVPLLPYAYAAMDRMWAHLASGEALPPSSEVITIPRGTGPLGAMQLAVPGD